MVKLNLLPLCAFVTVVSVFAQPAAQKLVPNLESNIERPLRYRPDGADFVIENGTEFFNRPLYGGNTAFRVDGGDKPEFVLYLPGRGGNLRLGVERVDLNTLSQSQPVAVNALHHAKWLHDAASITTRYRPGELLYEIRDPLLGAEGVINLAVLAYHQAEGLIVRVEAANLAPGVELVWAYGGINGQRGSRDGDIGTERVPISQYFQLQPDFCKDNNLELGAGSFTLRAKAATIAGLVPPGAQLAVGDAAKWNDIAALLAEGPAPALPIVVGHVPLANHLPLLLSLQRLDAGEADDLSTYKEVTAKVERVDPNALASKKRAEVSAFHHTDLPRLFAETEQHFAALRNHVAIVTPDPFINAAVGALNVAADAVWDEPQQAIMHGAIAWRTKLLGWRGPYSLDALGWTDRARANFTYWAGRQNTDPIPAKLPPADENANLARNEAGLHSNGDLSNSHYDMNLVFIDALFRHLKWTGDREFAKKMWPVIERHLAWERRLFRREFTTADGEKLPLYEAYAAIWASDDLQYSGGGTAHASAYNFYHNWMASELASRIGADPAPGAREAQLIERAMRELLWIGNHFAESKDWLGLQLVHPKPALWTFYHAVDSEVPGATAMADYINRLPRIPVRGPGVPTDQAYGLLSESNWMPYEWSINNVVMAENVHTALSLWQSAKPEEAFRLLKSSLLASMFMGISPGNVGSMNYLDVYRRESQRDFGDGSGVLSRALIEGLFGLRPDAFKGEMGVMPQFPQDWSHAEFSHPAVSYTFQRRGSIDVYTFTAIDKKFPGLEFALATNQPVRGMEIETPAFKEPKPLAPQPGQYPHLSLDATKLPLKITIEWAGPGEKSSASPAPLAPPGPWTRPSMWDAPLRVEHPETIDLAARFNDRVTQIFKNEYRSPRSPFVSLALPKQGLGGWAGGVNTRADIDDTGLRAAAAANGGKLALPGGLVFATPGPGDAKNILFTSQWDNYPREATVPLAGKARRLHLLMAGSTGPMQSRLDNGEVVVTYTDGTTSRLALRNPETWWPIEQDYFTDDYQFRLDGPLPTRVDLKTGQVRVLEAATFKGQGGKIPGGAATVLDLALDPHKELKSLTIRALANDVVIGLMAATLAR